MSHGYAYQPGLLTADQVKIVTAHATRLLKAAGSSGTVKAPTQGDPSKLVVDENLRKSRALFIQPYEQQITEKLKKTAAEMELEQRLFASLVGIGHIVNGSTLNGSNIALDSYPKEPIQLTKYVKGDFYKGHVDQDYSPGHGRKLSMSVTLRGAQDGGEFFFEDVQLPDDVKKAINKPGAAIVFPSWAKHGVTEVKKGIRLSLVMWMSGVIGRVGTTEGGAVASDDSGNMTIITKAGNRIVVP